jgi:hypothetical protein
MQFFKYTILFALAFASFTIAAPTEDIAVRVYECRSPYSFCTVGSECCHGLCASGVNILIIRYMSLNLHHILSYYRYVIRLVRSALLRWPYAYCSGAYWHSYTARLVLTYGLVNLGKVTITRGLPWRSIRVAMTQFISFFLHTVVWRCELPL